MVFGNRSVDSGTGVLFTRNPSTGEPGCTATSCSTPRARTSWPAPTGPSRSPSSTSGCRPSAASCASTRRGSSATPATSATSSSPSSTAGCGCSSAASASAARRPPSGSRVDMAEDPDFPLTRAEAVRRVAGILANPADGRRPSAIDGVPVLATGLPASPGLASRRDRDLARGGRRRRGGRPDRDPGPARRRRPTTSTAWPDRPASSPRCGGLASHAAVVARGWGIPAVVGAAGVEVGDGIVTIGDRTFRAGETITIDGDSGEVFAGTIAGESVVVPEARDAPGLGGASSGSRSATHRARPTSRGSGRRHATERPRAVGADDLLRMLAGQGLRNPGIGRNGPPVHARRGDRDSWTGSWPTAWPSWRPGRSASPPTARRSAGSGSPATPRAWGEANARAALDAFLALDHRMKETVTAWQMREVDGTQTFNDHSDPAYDASVLADLDALHADARAWAYALEAGLPAPGRLPGAPGARGRGGARRRPALRRVAPRGQLPRRSGSSSTRS